MKTIQPTRSAPSIQSPTGFPFRTIAETTKPTAHAIVPNRITFMLMTASCSILYLPNGLRYPLVGGTGQRRFTGINFKPRKVLENAQTPTSRVHAVLGALTERQPICLITNTDPF